MHSQIRYWTTWSVCHKDEPDGAIALFQSRAKAREYIELKREQALFQNGQVNEAVEYWNINNFIIDYSASLTRSSVAVLIEKPLADWNHD